MVHPTYSPPYTPFSRTADLLTRAFFIAPSNTADETEFVNRHLGSTFRFTRRDSLIGEVLTTGEPIVSNDPMSHAGSLSSRGQMPRGHPHLSSFVGIPVRFGDRMVGVLGLGNRQGGYTQELVDQLLSGPVLATFGSLIEGRRNHRVRAVLTAELEAANVSLERRLWEKTQTAVRLRKEMEDRARAERERNTARATADVFIAKISHELRWVLPRGCIVLVVGWSLLSDCVRACVCACAGRR